MKQWLNIDKPYDQINHMHCHCLYDRILISRIHNGVQLKEGLTLLAFFSYCAFFVLVWLLINWNAEWNGLDWIGMRWNGLGMRWINGMDWREMD